MTDKDAIRKYLDEYQATNFGKPMTAQTFINQFEGHENLYNSAGQEMEEEGRLIPLHKQEPEEIREEIFGKPPEKIRVQVPSTTGRLYRIMKVTRKGKSYEIARDSKGRFTKKI